MNLRISIDPIKSLWNTGGTANGGERMQDIDKDIFGQIITKPVHMTIRNQIHKFMRKQGVGEKAENTAKIKICGIK